MRTTIIIVLVLLIWGGCSKKQCDIAPEISQINIDLKINRLEQELFNLKTKTEVNSFIHNYPDFSKSFLNRSEYPHDSMLVNRLYNLIHDPHIDSLYQETQQVFGDFSQVEQEFRRAFQHIKHYYPQFEAPRIYTMITGMSNDLFVSNDMIVIGLDFFLGEGAQYRPLDIPQYILKRYQKEYIVPSVVLLLSNKFNQTNYQDKSMLADMIFYGKSYYFTKQMMPCANDSLIIGYSGQELEDIDQHEDIIWANFLENELLYETSHIIKNKFFGERPKVFEIGDKCPGRIGAWVGWEIVQQYMENEEGVSLPELMADTKVQEIFKQSRYKPF
ncbi:MAG: gliding motility lipoprotein GldB [Candidatus Cyclobacteriaceae bacterium M3_2C_046]